MGSQKTGRSLKYKCCSEKQRKPLAQPCFSKQAKRFGTWLRFLYRDQFYLSLANDLIDAHHTLDVALGYTHIE
jgi:hypothetical protein